MPTLLLALRSDGSAQSCSGSPRRGELPRQWQGLRRTSGKILRPCSPISAATTQRWMSPRPMRRAATSAGTPPHDVSRSSGKDATL